MLGRGFGIEIFVNGVLPWLVYVSAQSRVGRVHALMLSALPPIAWNVFQLVRKRRIDALSILVLTGIGLSLVAFLGGGSFRVLELREHLVTGLMGLIFLGSVAIKRPVLVAILPSLMEEKSRVESMKIQGLLNDRRRFDAHDLDSRSSAIAADFRCGRLGLYPVGTRISGREPDR